MGSQSKEGTSLSDLALVVICLATIAFLLRVQLGPAGQEHPKTFEPAVTSAGLEGIWRDSVRAKDAFAHGARQPTPRPEPPPKPAPAAAPEPEPEPTPAPAPARAPAPEPRDPPDFKKVGYSFWNLSEKASTNAFEDAKKDGKK